VDEFDDFARDSRARLVGLAYSLTGDRGVSEDLAQESLLATHGAWSDVTAPLAYARRTVVHLAATRVRSAGRERRAFARWFGRGETFTELAPTDAEFWRAVAALPRRQREVIALHYVEDLPVADIALALEIAPGSVKSALHDARASLRRTLGIEGEEDR